MNTAVRPVLIAAVLLGVFLPAVADDGPRTEPDPWVVADALLVASARVAEPGERLAAAEAFARTVPNEATSRALVAYVERWRALTPEELERALRLADAWQRMIAARAESAWGESEQALAGVREDLTTGPETTAVVGIHGEATLALPHLDRSSEVVAHGRTAAETADRLGWLREAEAQWHRTARFATKNGEYDVARRLAERALDAATRSGDKRPRPVLRHDLAIATYRAGDLPDGLRMARTARLEAFAAKDFHTAARILSTMVNIHLAKGDLGPAIQMSKQAIAEAEKLGDRNGWLKTKANLAGVYIRADRYAEAIAICEEILASPEAAEDPQLFAATSANLAGAYRELGKFDEAIRHLERALEAARGAGLSALVLELEAGLASVLLYTDQVERSPEVLQRILAYYKQTGNKRGAAQVLASLAAAYARLDRTEEQAAARAEALQTFEALGDRLCVARLHFNVALAHEGRKQWPAALQANAAALRAYQELGFRGEDLALALFGRARIFIQVRALDSAVPLLAEARSIYVDLLHGLGEEDAIGLAARARTVSDWGVALASGMMRIEPSRGPEAAALAYLYLESARAILLAEALANARELLEAELPPEILAEERESRERVELARMDLSALATTGGGAADVAAAKAALDDAWRARRAAVSRVQRSARRTAAIAYPEVTPLAAVQEALDPGTVLVSYRLLRRGFALVVSQTDATLVRLTNSEDIRAGVNAYLRVASTPELSDSTLAAKLHAQLIAPIEALLGDAEHLVVSPDGELAYLPFAALLDPGADDDRGVRLVERFAISMVPSATVWATLASEAATDPGEHLLGVGDPVYPSEEEGMARGTFGRLPQSGAEVDEIAAFFPPESRTLLLRDDATVARTVEALRAAPARFRAVHLACHAVVDAEHPRRSGLVLGGGETLDVDALLALRIPSDLAVLSACETARGKLAHGEGVMGFVRAFFHAGVPRVVVSSWQISDASTRPLMRAFYAGLVEHDLSPAEALRRAQAACLEEGGPGSRAHPYHWAAFALWGLDP